jgi:hypothetical protein
VDRGAWYADDGFGSEPVTDPRDREEAFGQVNDHQGYQDELV